MFKLLSNLLFAVSAISLNTEAKTDLADIEELEQCSYAIKAFRTESNNDDDMYIVYNPITEKFELGTDASGEEGAWLVQFDFQVGMVALFNVKAEKFMELKSTTKSYEDSIGITDDV